MVRRRLHWTTGTWTAGTRTTGARALAHGPRHGGGVRFEHFRRNRFRVIEPRRPAGHATGWRIHRRHSTYWRCTTRWTGTGRRRPIVRLVGILVGTGFFRRLVARARWLAFFRRGSGCARLDVA